MSVYLSSIMCLTECISEVLWGVPEKEGPVLGQRVRYLAWSRWAG